MEVVEVRINSALVMQVPRGCDWVLCGHYETWVGNEGAAATAIRHRRRRRSGSNNRVEEIQRASYLPSSPAAGIR